MLKPNQIITHTHTRDGGFVWVLRARKQDWGQSYCNHRARGAVVSDWFCCGLSFRIRLTSDGLMIDGFKSGRAETLWEALRSSETLCEAPRSAEKLCDALRSSERRWDALRSMHLRAIFFLYVELSHVGAADSRKVKEKKATRNRLFWPIASAAPTSVNFLSACDLFSYNPECNCLTWK